MLSTILIADHNETMKRIPGLILTNQDSQRSKQKRWHSHACQEEEDQDPQHREQCQHTDRLSMLPAAQLLWTWQFQRQECTAENDHRGQPVEIQIARSDGQRIHHRRAAYLQGLTKELVS